MNRAIHMGGWLLFTAPLVGIAIYFTQVMPFWFARKKDPKDFKDSKDLKNAA